MSVKDEYSQCKVRKVMQRPQTGKPVQSVWQKKNVRFSQNFNKHGGSKAKLIGLSEKKREQQQFQINSRVIYRVQNLENSFQRINTGSDQLGQTNPLVETNETKEAEPHVNQLIIDNLNMNSSRKSRQSIQPGTAQISNIPGQQSSKIPYIQLSKRTQSPKSMLRNLN